MPEEDYAWLPHQAIFSFEEISRIADAFVSLGVDKIRLTGGEPLLRKGLPQLIRMLAGKNGMQEVAMTTNGVVLAQHAAALKIAGLSRVTVSLDTLRAERFVGLSRRSSHAEVLEGIRSLAANGFSGTKIDTVAMRRANDDQLTDLIEFGKTIPAEVRFIEYMDVGGATAWTPSRYFPGRRYSRPWPLATVAWRLPTRLVARQPVRVTRRHHVRRRVVHHAAVLRLVRPKPVDRRWNVVPVLVRRRWHRHAPIAQRWATRDELRWIIKETWTDRRDQGAVERLALRDRRTLIPVAVLRT